MELFTHPVIVNEFMPAPLDDEPEWIELYNPNDSTLTLLSYSISDASNTKILPEIIIYSKSYCILTKDTFALKEKRIIPASIPLYEMNFPTLNNTTDEIVLKNENSEVVDSVFYNMKWGKKGISLERIDWEKVCISSENMLPSVSKDSATCGWLNSVSIAEYDLKLDSVFILNYSSLCIAIRNNGKNLLNNCYLKQYIDLNKNNIYEENELFLDGNLIISDDNITKNEIPLKKVFSFLNSSGEYSLLTYIYNEKDERQENDSLKITLNFPEVLNRESSITVSPNPFSTIDISGKNHCDISYILPFEEARVIALIYDINGLEVKKLYDSDVKEKVGSIKWDGTNENGFRMPQGAYILYFEANDKSTNNVFSEKILIVIGK
ncbi:MAG TPA: lamin tail domain-containing protein [Candidatus Kapabacteria bacterium]|nr:lamin tail domain-containing protein [Candidatus Kapabacteria bacterium]